MTTLPQTAPIRVPRPMPAGPLAMPPAAAGQLALGGAGSSAMTVADVFRVIRQNLLLIILAVIAGGVCGYYVNKYLAKHHPKYKTFGYLMVRSPSELPEPGKPEAALRPEEIGLLQETHARTIMHEALFAEVLDNPRTKDVIRNTNWFKSFENETDPIGALKRNLRDNLVAAAEPRSRLVRVEMTTPDREDAKVIVESLVEVYVEKVSDDQRNNERKQIELLTKETKLLQNELDQQVTAQLASMEREFGKDNVEIYSQWNGKRMQLDQLLQSQTQIKQQMAGLEVTLRSLEENLRDGKTPSEVQTMMSRDGRYLNARQRVDEMKIMIGQLVIRLGEGHDHVIANQKLRAAYEQMLDEVREELKDDFAESYRSTLNTQLLAYTANRTVIEEAIQVLGKELGKLNEGMTAYAVLKEKERRLRDRIAIYEADVRRVREFRLAVPFSQAAWQSRPQVPDVPTFPKLWVTLAVSVMLALALSLGIAFLREMTDTTVRSPKDIAKVGQLTLLGLIPHESDDPQAEGSRLPLAILDAPNSHIAEQFRQIRTRLQYAHSLDTTRSLLITSPSPEDGKSMVACNLAASLALNGRRILLVDANFRRPTLHASFNVPNDVGFGDVLTDLDKLPGAARETDVPNLSLLSAGTRPTNPTELLESQFFIDFVERALEEYDHVIFDSGPMLMVSDAVAMAPRVDGVITVVRARGNSRGLLQRLRDELRRVKAEHIGVVLNAVRSRGGGYYGRNIKSYYEYGNQA